MNRIDRLFGILTLLQTKKFVSAETIANRFGISIRTVYRDIRALCEGGIPVSFEQGKGYFVVQGYFLPPVSFSSEEANALLLMEAMVKGFADSSIHRHYSSALQKVKAVLRAPQKESVEFLQSNIKLQLPNCMQNDYDYLSLLQTGISNRVQLEIGYKNNKGEVSKRRLEPIGLVFYAFSWHLIAWCHLREQYRDFKVGRILSVKDLALPFKVREHLQLADYLKQLPVAY